MSSWELQTERSSRCLRQFVKNRAGLVLQSGYNQSSGKTDIIHGKHIPLLARFKPFTRQKKKALSNLNALSENKSNVTI